MARNLNKKKVLSRNINYLNKDFESFRSDLLNYSKTHFADKIQDFSEAGLGGLFIDMASYVGDVMSFYLDHQFNELNLETAIEEDNIEKLIRASGVKITSAAPAFANIILYIKIPSVVNSLGNYIPDRTKMPVIQKGTTFSSLSGVNFELLTDIDSSKTDLSGNLIADYVVNQVDSSNNPIDYIVKLAGTCSSASTYQDSFTFNNQHKPFRKIKLSKLDISEIISIIDSDGNEYFEVDDLTQDTVFLKQNNNLADSTIVGQTLSIQPAPRRFVTIFNRNTGVTEIQFGSGRSDSYDDDIIPDPSDHALPLYGDRKTFSRFSIDPNKLMSTSTLGISPMNTTLTVNYRYGGGLSHNITTGQITTVKTLLTKFQTGISATEQRKIRSSIEVYNETPAIGGADRPSLDEARAIALNYNATQNRIVTQQDLISRVYTMPSTFGKVFRIGVRKNQNNPHSTSISVVTRDSQRKLAYASDTLKNNIATYINEFRIVGDSIDILDAPIINYRIDFTITVDNRYNQSNVLVQVINRIKETTKIEKMQIDQPINLTDLELIIASTPGVQTVNTLNVSSLSGIINTRTYPGINFDVNENTFKGLIYPTPGGIFELRYSNDDIRGRVI